jgi:ATP-dependent RNA helicase DeaD
MTKLKFEELDLSSEIQSAINDMGFEEASPIQAEAIPLIIQGKDVIGQAQTGTGKTAAFAIPVIEKLDPENRDLQAIVLCPTRELVIQVSEEFRKLMKYKEHLYVVPVYGGQEIERQLRGLRKGAQVVIGTPGRTMDHMRRGSIKMDSVKTVVLDEADEMLDMGFRDDMEFILKDTSSERQTIMFSATMAKDITDLSKKFLKDPTIINVTHKKLNAPKIQQIYFEVLEKNKPEVLARLIDLHNIKLALVFCNTKSQVDQLVDILKTRGYFADALHGDMNQNQRDKVMNGFRNGTVEILVATDVAGRGIDVNNVEAVFNYDLPRDDEDYVHRIGRTARAGKSGIAFTFIVGKQIYNLKRIERANGTQIIRQPIPTMDELEATRINAYLTKVGEIIEAGHLSKYINQVEMLMGEEYTSIDVSAALLKLIMEKENEGFDHNANFEIPREEFKPAKKRFPDKRTGSRFEKKDNFKKSPRKKEYDKEFKPFGSSEGKPSGFVSDDKGFGDKKKRSYKDSPKREYKPFSALDSKPKSFESDKPYKKEDKSFESDKPYKKDDKRFKSSDKPKFSSFKDSPKGEYKPFKSSDSKTKSSESDKPYKKEDKRFKSSDKPKSGSFKENKFSKEKFGKTTGDKKPVGKFKKK